MIWRWLSLLLLVGAAAAGVIHDTKVSFDGYRVYRVVPVTQQQVDFLQDLENQYDDYSFWSRPVLNRTVDVMVSPFLRIDFRDIARAVGLDAKIFIEDVQKLINNENPKGRAASDYGWDAYYPLSDVEEWMLSLPEKFGAHVEVIDIAESFLEKKIKGVKISKKENNKIIFVESGIHAREWITVATATYLINELLTSTKDTIKNVVENFDWIIVPSTNPDGYDYSHKYNRLWRKTRSKRDNTLCYGADPNRNWAYAFNNEAGSSSKPCSETYRGGAEPFTEKETETLSKTLIDLNESGKLLVYFSLHSYSEVLMVPYGLPGDEPFNWDVLEPIGNGAIKELEKHYGTSYKFNKIYEAIGYSASGGSIDWVMDTLKVPYVFEWELRDKGLYGFLLPASQIVPTADETIASMVYILEKVQENESARKSKIHN